MQIITFDQKNIRQKIDCQIVNPAKKTKKTEMFRFR